MLQCTLYHFQRDPGPLRAATPDLNIWGANLSLTPERSKAGNQPLCRTGEIVFCLSLTAPFVIEVEQNRVFRLLVAGFFCPSFEVCTSFFIPRITVSHMRVYSQPKVGYGSDFFPFWKRSAQCRPSISFNTIVFQISLPFFSFKPSSLYQSAIFCFPLSCIPLIKFHLSFFLLLLNFLHKDHSLGCVIPPSHTSSFPTILLSDEGRSSLPFPLFPYVFSALLSLSLSLSLPLSLCLSLPFSLWVFAG